MRFRRTSSAALGSLIVAITDPEQVDTRMLRNESCQRVDGSHGGLEVAPDRLKGRLIRHKNPAFSSQTQTPYQGKVAAGAGCSSALLPTPKRAHPGKGSSGGAAAGDTATEPAADERLRIKAMTSSRALPSCCGP